MRELPVIEKSSGNEARTGTNIVNGYILEEYLGALKNARVSYDIYDKMRRSDPQIKRVLNAIQTPIQGATFTFTPIDAKDEKQVHQAKFKTALLYDYLGLSDDGISGTKFTGKIFEILSYLAFGFALFEPIYAVEDTKEFGSVIVLKDLLFLKQKTIHEWNIKDGALKSVRQVVNQSSDNSDKIVDVSGFLLFTNDREGDNYEGVSILRSCYGSYLRKELFYKIDMIGIEKMAIGTPVAYVNDSLYKNEKEMEAIKSVLESLTAHEKQYVILPASMKDGGFTIEKGQYDSTAVNASIDRENMEIIGVVLASFMDIGTMRAGGNSQSTTLYQMFMDSIDHIIWYICESIGPLLHQIYTWNFGEPDVNLPMQGINVSKKNQREIAEILAIYVKAGLLTPDRNIEEKVRSDNNFAPYEDAAVTDKSRKSTKKSTKKDAQIGLSEKKLSERRQLTEYENARHLDAIESALNASQSKYETIIREHLEMAKGKYLSDLEAALKSENPLKATMGIKIGFMGQMRSEMMIAIKGMMKKARAQAAKELKKSTGLDEGLIDSVSEILLFKIKKIVSDIESDFENKSTLPAIQAISDEASSAAVVDAVDMSLSGFIASSVPYRSSGAIVNEMTNVARNNFFFENTDLLQGFQFSSVLDAKTTELCASLDGQTFKTDDERAYVWRPPLHWFCRSILVPITIGMKTPEWTGLYPVANNEDDLEKIIKQKQF